MAGPVLLFLNGLPGAFSSEDLESLCSPFGTVLLASVIRDSLRRSLEFGFVEMETTDDAVRVMEGLQGRAIRGSRLAVMVVRRQGDAAGNA
jgi:RNA recognition motif-containing protein